MPINLMARARHAGAAVLFLGGASCTDFLTVPNPTLIDAGAINPAADAPILANSAQQNFATSYGLLIMYAGWMTGETQVAETFPTRNEFGRRDIVNTNGSLSADVWTPLARTLSEARFVLALSLPTPATNLVRAQVALYSAYGFLFMAEHFCGGAVGGGPLILTAAMLDSAVANFSIAISIGRAAAAAPGALAATVTLANQYANIAFVGRARAQLQAGRPALAAQDADSVSAGFTYSLPYVDDLANRTRLANTMHQFTRDRGSIMVAPAYRTGSTVALGGLGGRADPRVTWVNGAGLGFSAQDASSGTFFVQRKYTGYADGIRLASKLETDYIKAEATGGTAGQLALIALRRTAAGDTAYTLPVTASGVLTELMNQKAFDFYLEGKRLGDLRRNPANVTNAPTPGAVYFKGGFPVNGSRVCYPIPNTETDNNPNHPSTP